MRKALILLALLLAGAESAVVGSAEECPSAGPRFSAEEISCAQARGIDLTKMPLTEGTEGEVSIGHLTWDADVVVIGKVVAIEHDFTDPYPTLVQLRISDSLKGGIAGTIAIALYSGPIYDASSGRIGWAFVNHEPEFAIGEEVLVFLTTRYILFPGACDRYVLPANTYLPLADTRYLFDATAAKTPADARHVVSKDRAREEIVSTVAYAASCAGKSGKSSSVRSNTPAIAHPSLATPAGRRPIGRTSEPALKCDAAKLEIAANYVVCRKKTTAKSVAKGEAADFTKCRDTFIETWNYAAIGEVGVVCPDSTTAAAIMTLLASQTAAGEAIIAGPAAATCGDGSVNAVGEQCDGSDFDNTTCTSLGYRGGPLACNGSCRFDASGCGRCADRMVEYEGSCWLLSSHHLGAQPSCDAACAAVGLTCDEPALNRVSGAGTNEECGTLIDLLAPGTRHERTFMDMSWCGQPQNTALGCVLEPRYQLAKRTIHRTAPKCGADNSNDGCFLEALPRRACACK